MLHRRLQQQIGLVDTAEFLGAAMHVNQLLSWPRHLQQRVAAGGHLTQANTQRDDQIGFTHARSELGVDADAHVAGVLRMSVVEGVLEAECAANR